MGVSGVVRHFRADFLFGLFASESPAPYGL
jgi:hypothetical protein